jgi:hypothetical protein
VILTGGDPLVLSPRRLRSVMKELSAIGHVKVVRIHTRVPVAEPKRITSELVRAMKAKGKAVYVAIHVNHARELTKAARLGRARMADAGLPLLGQSVLLAGVNDTPQALTELMRACVECRIKPYYLHHGDLAPGTAHLRTTLEQGQQLMRTLRGRVSGLCQPEYVLDIPGGRGKSPVGPSYLSQANSASEDEPGAETRYRVADYCGDVHLYPPKPCCNEDRRRKDRAAAAAARRATATSRTRCCSGFSPGWWVREFGCSAPWLTCGRFRIVLPRDAAIVQRSKSRNGCDSNRRSKMRKLITTTALLILIGSPAAIAQTGTGGSSTATKNPPREAPIGHRQPRASDVPPEKNLNDPNDLLSKENAILDRKIKGICRGC